MYKRQPPAASPSPDPGTYAPDAPLHFAGIALRVRRGKSEVDSELGDWQEFEGGGRVLRIRLSNALVCSQFPRRPIPQPLGSERWQADTGASASITNHRSDIFNVREVNSNEEFEQIGNKGLMPIVAIGSVLLRFVFLREGDGREHKVEMQVDNCLLYTSPSPRD